MVFLTPARIVSYYLLQNLQAEYFDCGGHKFAVSSYFVIMLKKNWLLTSPTARHSNGAPPDGFPSERDRIQMRFVTFTVTHLRTRGGGGYENYN